MRIEQHANLDELAIALAGELIGVCRARQADGGVPCVVLTGGTGGARALEALAAHPDRDTVNWSRVQFIWGDERWVPVGHEDRNDLLADAAFFGSVEVDQALVHRVAGSDSGRTLDEAAAAYAELVSSIDRIDVALNGVGPDGHVASLFPGRAELLLTGSAEGDDVPDAIAIRESPKPPPERVTLTLPALRRAERVWLIAAGTGKADAISRVVSRTEPLLPAALISGTTETVLWADEAALAGV